MLKTNVRKVDPVEFLRLVSVGASSTEVMRAFGISPQTLSYWRSKLGVTTPMWRRCDHRRVRELVSAGMTDRQVAEAVGVGVYRVRRVRAKLGMPPNDGRDTDEYRETMREHLSRRTKECGSARSAKCRERRREVAGRYGLPADLTMTQVRVVLALTGGPMEVAALADATGRPEVRRKPRGWSHYHRFNLPAAKGGNQLTALRRAGLVFSAKRGRSGCVYSLTPLCMELMTGGRHDDDRAGCDDFGRDPTGSGGAGGAEAAARPVGR